ncbi:hypothetical protein Tco_0886100 [Tanacetum coccineum]
MTTTTAQQVALDNALKELTYQVVLDALTLTTCYPAFLITADVPEIYMHQFWFTINKHDSSYQFKIGKKRFTLNMEVFREIFQIYPRLPNQDFDKLLSDEEIVSFIKELSHKGNIKSITDVGMYYKKNVDFVELLWEDFVIQIDNRDTKKQEKIYYPKFTKAVIHHFITKDKTISIRNILFMHTAQDDCVVKDAEFSCLQDLSCICYWGCNPKKARKFKKPASPSKKRTLVAVKEEEPELAKKVVSFHKPSRKQSAGVVFRDTPGVTASKKKTPTITVKSKALTCFLISGDGTGSKLGVPDEPKGKSVNTNEGTTDDERTNYDNQETNDDKEKSDDEFVHTPLNYVPTDVETNDESNDVDKEDRIDKELYGDVNISLTDAEQDDEDKKDAVVSMMDINVQHEVPRTSPLLTIPVSVIPEHTVFHPSEIITKAITSAIAVPESETLSAIHQRITDLEKDVKELKNVDNSLELLSTIKSKVPNAIKEYLGTSLDDALYKVLQKHSADIAKEHSMDHARKHQVPKETITSSNTVSLKEFDQKTTFFNIMTKSKSLNKSPKHRALYHDLMESILKDEDAMDEGVADKLKKRKPDNADQDEGPTSGSDRGLKR